MRYLVFFGALFASLAVQAQTCPNPSSFNPCELTFDLPAGANAAGAQLDAEFRSPTFATFKMPGFWNGRQFVVRFSPTEAGAWIYRTTSTVAALNGARGEFTAADSGLPGFLQVDNTRAWSYTAKHQADASREAHLWMGFNCPQCLTMERAAFDKLIAERAGQNFNHVRVLLPATLGGDDSKAFDEIDARMRAIHDKGLFSDVQFAPTAAALRQMAPTPAARDRYIQRMVAHYAAFGVTWQGVGEYEIGEGGRDLLRDVGMLLRKHDPYNHPRSTGSMTSSSGLWGDEWMTYIVQSISDDQVGSIESQVYQAPRIGAESPKSPEEFGRRLWNATMSGQYPSFTVNTDAEAKMMAAWSEFMSRTRFWEIEPHFDVDGGRALYLTGTEYIAYIDKPGTLDILTEKKGYQVYWMNVATGVIEKQKKDFKGERFSTQPPGPGQWVLHLSRDGRKEGMAKSYHFASRRVVYQEVESNPQKVPFVMDEPEGDTFQVGKPVPYEIHLARESRGTREMAYVLTAEATVNGQGARVLATGPKGQIVFPANLAATYPAVVNLHLLGRNANGKVYSLDRVVRVTQ